ncbi:chemotaxis protein CheW [Chryseosolibacter indicus]|uniref:Chemotaxis protein CheW n=1 Tax=Chryseosolibacter indicus TaxID=2782351 RepID=A0ABS5VSV3_9BACT|nr:chemotaxis protein CheW [Chryseosolibacter indicus]MBT1704518.1 chemotaxis protein CheW [Chryseosolibacter indicus]
MQNESQLKSYITFGLGDEKFALAVDHVQEIVELDKVTKIPNAPHYMLGIINLRGKVLPLLDTRLKLGLSEALATKKSRIMVIDIMVTDEKVIQIGALVDVAKEVIELSPSDIQEAPEFENYNTKTPITGVVNNKGDITMIMDVNKVFSSADILQLNQIMN